ncbi:M14 family metallopeptidase [Aureibaculum sp. 2210JD6-5]|uniref:M14 family metallopeptidase n=1 Tax=Aureibaculum sp. 2210JD6-5 TaxID=3103957 RepID=UPI002AAD833F|nr:M14 family metallopeptidase [Aureibaculum sp. 2210JD6-5]MDY7396819.1 M14 family metallopeptidase [Aureibaculum sp. 2210JD6-5]
MIKLKFVRALIFLFFIASCSSAKKVTFSNPVDTETKPIAYQQKQTYKLPNVAVYASNEFDGARLNGFEQENDSTALVIIHPENAPINNSPYYAFKTWSNTTKPFYFKFQYPKGYKHRYIPKLNINGKWSILDTTQVFKQDTIVTVKLNLTETPITVAAQEINSSTDVKNWYSDLIKGKEGVVTVESAGKSRLGKNLPVLNISKDNTKDKDVIVLITRQHPPEVTGYFAFQSFLIEILQEDKLSQQFLNKYHIIAFPIMNPDGVDLGHWRHNEGGVDLNRDWGEYNQPEIKQVVSYINKTLKRNRAKLILGLDFHSTWYDVFYTNTDRENTNLPNFEEKWFTALEEKIPDYKVNEASANSNRPTSKGWFLNGQNAVGITYEIGDDTPREFIKLKGKVSAEEMMKILIK